MTAGQLRSDGARRERDITDIPGAKNVGDVSFTAPDGLREPTTDTRAPQNLYPIAGLERPLRRRVGDVMLLHRGLRRAGASDLHECRR